MPTITQGNTASGTFGYLDSITVTVANGGSAKFESPTGTVVSVFSGTETLGPYSFQTWTLTAVTGSVFYEVADGNILSPVSVDKTTGGLVDATGATVSGAGNFQLKAMLFGDSFSYRVNQSGVSYRQSDYSYWVWANLLMGSPMRLVANQGISGNTTTQMVARLDAAVAVDAGICFVQGGINDFSSSASVETVVANLQTICNALRRTRLVVLLAIAPNTAPASNAFKVIRANESLRRWAQTVGNVIFADVFTAMVNATDTTGALASGMSDDALHPSPKGARAMGAAIAAVLGEYVPAVSLLPSSAADSYAVDASSNQILTNPLFSGTTGSVSGAGASGTLATSWNGGTDTGSVTSVFTAGVPRSDGIGADQQIAMTSAGSGAIVNMRSAAAMTGRVSAGDTIYACGAISLSGMTDVAAVYPSLSITVGGTAYAVHCLDPSLGTWDQSDVSFSWRTPDFLLTDVPSVLSIFLRIRFGTSGAGAATMKIGRTGIYKYVA